jgi:hypothetical protein
VGEQVPPEVEGEALADPGRDVLVAEREHRAQQGEADHDRDVEGERAERLGHEHVVDDQLEEPDLGRLDQREQRRERQTGEEHLAERARVGPEAAQDLAYAHGRRGRDELGVVGGGGEAGG